MAGRFDADQTTGTRGPGAAVAVRDKQGPPTLGSERLEEACAAAAATHIICQQHA